MSVGVFEVVRMEENYLSDDEDENYCEELVQYCDYFMDDESNFMDVTDVELSGEPKPVTTTPSNPTMSPQQLKQMYNTARECGGKEIVIASDGTVRIIL